MSTWNIFRAVLVAAVFGASAPVHAVNHNETTNGDLSNSGSSPTQLTLSAGSNLVTATMPGSDLDFLTVHIPVDHVFSALTLVSYTSTDGTSFIGMKNGTTIAVTGNPATLNGYTHFGTVPGNVGQDILDDIGMGFGSVGFTPPLATGAYSFWIQQANTVNVSYQFDFMVTALPPPGLDGDYNDNDVVDAADFVVWRKMLNQTGPDLAADGNGDEVVNQLDYDFWSARFGNMASGAGSAIPEPASLVLLAVGVGSIRMRVLNRRHRGAS
ncbi:MAG: hypothetical protein WD738_00565 [Pirellulales bacterium]